MPADGIVLWRRMSVWLMNALAFAGFCLGKLLTRAQFIYNVRFLRCRVHCSIVIRFQRDTLKRPKS